MDARMNAIGIEVCEALKDKLTQDHGKFLGHLQSSIKYRIDGENIIISMEDYAEYLEYGCFFNEESEIITFAGKRKMKDLRIGQLIWTGKDFKKIINKPKFKINSKIKKIKITSNESMLEVTEDHPIFTNSGFKKAKDLKITDKIYKI